ncbi:hypothetical protein [Flavobacterium sp. NRK1]|uniref:hypothetical protein n=1 Tax=Flavobacterium sp. NRK1 TaxID=2954929 RepID=UPI002092A6E2|nr:hypothetical protein [Flavobacterium sp. NRK1]MCO6149335.1 hypothetical protein [Flavobacterium sp. NRK1]
MVFIAMDIIALTDYNIIMHYSGKVPVINKIITLNTEVIEIRYNNKKMTLAFSDVHDIKLVKMKIKKNILLLNTLLVSLVLVPIAFYQKFENVNVIIIYVILLLFMLHFKSHRYEQAYYIKIILKSGKRLRLKIDYKDRLDVIREITTYIDFRFRQSMYELFHDTKENKPSINTSAS